MKPTKAYRILAQQILAKHVNPDLEPDGDFYSISEAAAKAWLGVWSFKGKPTRDRYVAAVIQKEALALGFNPGAFDAFWGSQTQDAADRILLLLSGRNPNPMRIDEQIQTVSSKLSSIRCWSPTTSQLTERYGKVGENQTMVDSPYPLRLDWDLSETVTRFSAHEYVADRIELAMNDLLAHYTLDGLRKLGLDRFGGCLNVRLKRGGSTYSTHSWGIALDWFPSRNQLKQSRKTALFAKTDYDMFFDIWEKHGFMSLGRCYDFDWMHLQANP